MAIFGEKIDKKDHEALLAAAISDAMAAYDMEGTTLTVDMYKEKADALATAKADLEAAQSALALKDEEVTTLTAKVAELNKVPEGPSGKSPDGDKLETGGEDRMALIDALPHNVKADASGYGA